MWVPSSMKQACLVRAALAVALVEANKLRTAIDNSENVQAQCKDYVCSDGWALKRDTKNPRGRSDADCCEKTCRLWSCGDGYASNEAYWGNIASSDMVCCDRACSSVECDAETGVPDEKLNKAGTTKEFCCEPLCSSFSCPAGMIPKPEMRLKIGSSRDTCCRPSCADHSCDRARGLLPNYNRQELPVPEEKENADSVCCVQTCKFFKVRHDEGNDDDMCLAGFVLDSAKLDDVTSSAEKHSTCCKVEPPKATLCKEVVCDEDWVTDPDNAEMEAEQAQGSGGCCMPTCKWYNCSEGWSKVPGNIDFAQPFLGDNECCEQTCAAHACNVSDGWTNSTDPAKLSRVGIRDELCCEPNCVRAGFECKAGSVLRPSAALTYNISDETCCELDECVKMRNRTQVTGTHCNGVEQERCNTSYFLHFENDENPNLFDVIPCYWNEDMELCRTDADNVLRDSCDFMEAGTVCEDDDAAAAAVALTLGQSIEGCSDFAQLCLDPILGNVTRAKCCATCKAVVPKTNETAAAKANQTKV